jgi:hypothetical protein
MELVGALSNQELQGRLRQLSDKLDWLGASGVVPRPSNRSDRILRPGLVLGAVTQVLAATKEPMRLCDIYAAVVVMLNQSVPHSSVKGCLAEKAQGSAAPFERVARGYYRLRGAG